MNPLLKRSLSGLILVVVMVECIVATQASFIAIWAVVAAACMWELLTLIRIRGGIIPERPFTILAGVALVVTASLATEGVDWVPAIAAIFLLFIIQLFCKSEVPIEKLAYSSLALVYIAVPIALLTTLEPMLVLSYITIVWANDTGAYLVGVTIGKHKMAPQISPKKSWEGFFGGILFSIGVAFVWYALYWSGERFGMGQAFGEQALLGPTIVKLKWLGLGLVIAVSSVAGDLIESKFKRSLGVKDSGRLIPGHGGALDRFDSVMISAPFVWCYVNLVDLLAVA